MRRLSPHLSVFEQQVSSDSPLWHQLHQMELSLSERHGKLLADCGFFPFWKSKHFQLKSADEKMVLTAIGQWARQLGGLRLLN